MNDEARSRPALRGARLRQVIEVEFNHGVGDTEADLVRRCFAYFDEKGALLAWSDSSDADRRINPSFMANVWRG